MQENLQQLKKLFKVSYFLFSQYLKIIFSYKDVQIFFTELYIKSRSQKLPFIDRNELDRCKLETLFPKIEYENIQVFAQYKSLEQRIYSKETGYLVSPDELFALSALANHLRPRTVFEIGTFKGWTLANLVNNLPSSTKVYTVDLDFLDPENDFIKSVLERENVQRFFANTYEFKFSDFDNSIDFIFVDAGHSRENVEHDTKHALKMLSPSGVIVWHDYNVEHPGVYDFLHELKSQIPIKAIANTSLAIFSRNWV